MSGQEKLRLCVMLAGWGLILYGAIKLFGIRRVLWFFALVLILAIAVAFRTLGGITGGRRY
jgi:hypothetical protein